MTERALVTGATGFIGSAVCRALCAGGHHVRALRRANSRLDLLEDLELELAVGDILQPRSLAPALKGIDWVFHAAAESAYWRQPEAVHRSAVEGTRNVMRTASAQGASRVILTSSISAMGVPQAGELLTENHVFNLPPDRFPYGFAKRQSELAALEAIQPGFEVVIVNPTIVLGPGDINRISGSMLIEAARGWGFFWMEGGINAVHVNDVAAGHLAAARLGRSGERYILGGENLSYREVATIINQQVGRRPPWVKLPRWSIEPLASLIDLLGPSLRLPFSSTQMRMTAQQLYCDTTKASRELNLEPARPFLQAVQDTYEWYRARGQI